MKESQQIYISDKRYQKAKERVESIKGFYGNLTAYCIVIPFLVWLNFKVNKFSMGNLSCTGMGFWTFDARNGSVWIQSFMGEELGGKEDKGING